MGTGRLVGSHVTAAPSAQCLNLIDQAQVTPGPALNLILFNQLSLINSLPRRSMIKVMQGGTEPVGLIITSMSKLISFIPQMSIPPNRTRSRSLRMSPSCMTCSQVTFHLHILETLTHHLSQSLHLATLCSTRKRRRSSSSSKS